MQLHHLQAHELKRTFGGGDVIWRTDAVWRGFGVGAIECSATDIWIASA